MQTTRIAEAIAVDRGGSSLTDERLPIPSRPAQTGVDEAVRVAERQGFHEISGIGFDPGEQRSYVFLWNTVEICKQDHLGNRLAECGPKLGKNADALEQVRGQMLRVVDYDQRLAHFVVRGFESLSGQSIDFDVKRVCEGRAKLVPTLRAPRNLRDLVFLADDLGKRPDNG